MAESPYAVRLDDLEARVRVPVSEQCTVEPAQPATTGLDWCAGSLVGDGGDGGGCD